MTVNQLVDTLPKGAEVKIRLVALQSEQNLLIVKFYDIYSGLLERVPRNVLPYEISYVRPVGNTKRHQFYLEIETGVVND